MTPGSIFLHRDFAFLDGTLANKYFVVLGKHCGTFIAAKTTSKGQRYRNEHGCQAGSYFAAFMLTKGCCPLPLNTWICFGEFYEFTVEDLTLRLVTGVVYAYGQLDDELTLDVQFCAAGCDDISASQESAVRNDIVALKARIAAKASSALGVPQTAKGMPHEAANASAATTIVGL